MTARTRKQCSIDLLVGLLSALLLLLMFTGGPGYYAGRVLKHLWNLGHVFAFFLWTWYLAHRWAWLKQKQPAHRIVLLIGVAFGAGLLVEGLQYGTARSADWQDIGRNMLGCMLAICWTRSICRYLTPVVRRTGRILCLAWVLLALWPMGRSLVDIHMARRSFPILADFETSIELERWSGDARHERSREVHLSGHYALQVTFGTETYSGVSLNMFPRDWRTYNALEIGIYNPDQNIISMTCRIHDRIHVQGPQLYADRFNRRYTLQPGWNRILVLLRDVQQAPAGRRMDLRSVMAVGLFASRLDRSRTVYLAHSRLLD